VWAEFQSNKLGLEGGERSDQPGGGDLATADGRRTEGRAAGERRCNRVKRTNTRTGSRRGIDLGTGAGEVNEETGAASDLGSQGLKGSGRSVFLQSTTDQPNF
jgi:hypothetical protein